MSFLNSPINIRGRTFIVWAVVLCALLWWRVQNTPRNALRSLGLPEFRDNLRISEVYYHPLQDTTTGVIFHTDPGTLQRILERLSLQRKAREDVDPTYHARDPIGLGSRGDYLFAKPPGWPDLTTHPDTEVFWGRGTGSDVIYLLRGSDGLIVLFRLRMM